MQSKPYTKYKPSGVEWLGDVPEHWEVTSLKFICRFAYGDSLASEDREDGDYLVFGSNGPVGTHKLPNTTKPVIVVGRKGSYGKINYSDNQIFAIDTTYFIDSRYTTQSIQWLKFSLLTLCLDIGSKDSAVPGLAREDAYEKRLPLPPLPEQQSIATFLDRETGRIDALIAKKKKLLSLLAEQRTALISRTVTKGLNPSVKLKPSGVEWLGDVPEHWDVKRLKFLGTALIGLTYSPDDVVDEEYDGKKHLVLRSTNIQDGKISLHENVYVTTKISDELNVKKWDILICARNGSRHLVGKNALITDDNNTMTFGAFTTVYRSTINAFLFYYFASNQFKYQSTGFLTTTINQLTNENLNSIIATLPPLPEQSAIADFLDRETAKIDTLSAKVQTAIERLREYRTALISAAVTGKIDVREAV